MVSLSAPCPKCVTTPFATLLSANHVNPSSVSFPNPSPCPYLSAPLLKKTVRQTSVSKLQAQFGEVAVKESSNSIPKPEASLKKDPAPASIPDAASINSFMTQVSDLVKLVDSRDIVELELKQQDCELLIRKKEALPLPPTPVAAAQPAYYAAPPPPPPPPQLQTAAAAAQAPSTSSRALPAPAKASASSHPPLKCPMAGTFYRCPGPGEPPFVKVGDKVQKGQVICIIEAMKLMNEIEADQSGTIAEILVEDGKPVSVDMPLFVISP
uniref:Biotin carboxyl carrier protein of acetyl-CoA carboxylase n=1 Tax=Kalanchoe fedtschenkoi TaxID=63787 RepID=A0A7N0T8G1_KALFE